MTGIVTDLNDITEGNFVTIDQISFQVAESKESFPNLCPNSRGMWKDHSGSPLEIAGEILKYWLKRGSDSKTTWWHVG